MPGLHIPGIPTRPNDKAARKRNGPAFTTFPHRVAYKDPFLPAMDLTMAVPVLAPPVDETLSRLNQSSSEASRSTKSIHGLSRVYIPSETPRQSSANWLAGLSLPWRNRRTTKTVSIRLTGVDK
ncbi:hypothetical protein, variant [Blastomyces dermatitidis ER-3]|nr:hypothetical protein, variant [Blastomyces gilchristii SLH14081]XP_045281932.1 hypothetical protein, variant [Blastomyces dermatitidis ER-3]EGE81220.2 hypothetical protein BDDG_04161 [Blastomyces dermatitidis ATCC 18188]OAT02205.1 hypothetical protein, variant [Blastomyces dermatitidis ER-3]OAT13953.1 hypothetical protein, variant [Blastomyces gilchristii SLH14081]